LDAASSPSVARAADASTPKRKRAPPSPPPSPPSASSPTSGEDPLADLPDYVAADTPDAEGTPRRFSPNDATFDVAGSSESAADSKSMPGGGASSDEMSDASWD